MVVIEIHNILCPPHPHPEMTTGINWDEITRLVLKQPINSQEPLPSSHEIIDSLNVQIILLRSERDERDKTIQRMSRDFCTYMSTLKVLKRIVNEKETEIEKLNSKMTSLNEKLFELEDEYQDFKKRHSAEPLLFDGVPGAPQKRRITRAQSIRSGRRLFEE